MPTCPTHASELSVTSDPAEVSELKTTPVAEPDDPRDHVERSEVSSGNKYCCEVCGKTFKHPSNLELHKRSHTGQTHTLTHTLSLSHTHTHSLTAHTHLTHSLCGLSLQVRSRSSVMCVGKDSHRYVNTHTHTHT